MKKTGLFILAIGVLLTLFSGFQFFTREKVVDIGAIEITANKKRSFDWSPLVGIAAIAVGGGIMLFGKQNRSINIIK